MAEPSNTEVDPVVPPVQQTELEPQTMTANIQCHLVVWIVWGEPRFSSNELLRFFEPVPMVLAIQNHDSGVEILRKRYSPLTHYGYVSRPRVLGHSYDSLRIHKMIWPPRIQASDICIEI